MTWAWRSRSTSSLNPPEAHLLCKDVADRRHSFRNQKRLAAFEMTAAR
jgi:hypothetical protein